MSVLKIEVWTISSPFSASVSKGGRKDVSIIISFTSSFLKFIIEILSPNWLATNNLLCTISKTAIIAEDPDE